MKCGSACSGRDLVCGWWAVVWWGIPTSLIIAGALLPSARAMLWIPSFAMMGLACLVNARGCGRLHCFVTGPLFLLGALATTLDELEIVSMDWKLIAAAMLLGTLGAYSLEWLRGKYVETATPS